MPKTTNPNNVFPVADNVSTTPAFPSHAMPPLDGDTGADVCVVGASFVGLRTAYDLLQKGKSVVVIDCAATLPEEAAREESARQTRLNNLLTATGTQDASGSAARMPATSSELAHAIVHLGGRIHGDTRALDISPEHNMQVVTTYQGAIVARVVVVATDERKLGSGTRGGRADDLKPGETPALRVLTTPAPNLAALFDVDRKAA
ncbi:MAG: FAD-dependent oxidoreductase [Massilia sp.]|nr:FAD-dependent oxidoreductase [Massilia sp.]